MYEDFSDRQKRLHLEKKNKETAKLRNVKELMKRNFVTITSSMTQIPLHRHKLPVDNLDEMENYGTEE